MNCRPALRGWASALVVGVTVGNSPARGADPGDFHVVRGSDPTFSEVMASGKIPRGRNSRGGFEGSTVRIRHELLREGPNARRPVEPAIRIHTIGNSFIPRRDFAKWSRWYQEDGNTQVFRLFRGEENVRNSRAKAARIEAFSALSWKRGEWREWAGTYTILKPHGAMIFQVKNSDNEWAVSLMMRSNGDVVLNHRRGPKKVIAENRVGRPFHVRVRDNGHDYEVYLDGKLRGEGSYARPTGTTGFRWGLYVGANDVRHDMMILVTGATVDPEDYDPALARVADSPAPGAGPDPRPEGLPIPARLWTNADGRTVEAPGVFREGDDHVKLHVAGQWVPYPLDQLSEDDRAALLRIDDFIER